MPLRPGPMGVPAAQPRGPDQHVRAGPTQPTLRRRVHAFSNDADGASDTHIIPGQGDAFHMDGQKPEL